MCFPFAEINISFAYHCPSICRDNLFAACAVEALCILCPDTLLASETFHTASEVEVLGIPC